MYIYKVSCCTKFWKKICDFSEIQASKRNPRQSIFLNYFYNVVFTMKTIVNVANVLRNGCIWVSKNYFVKRKD